MFAVKFLKLFFTFILNILLIVLLFVLVTSITFLVSWFFHYNGSDQEEHKSRPYIFSVEIPFGSNSRISMFDLSPIDIKLDNTLVNGEKPWVKQEGFLISYNNTKISDDIDYSVVVPIGDGLYTTFSFSSDTVINIVPLVAVAMALYVLIIAVSTNRSVTKKSLLGTVKAINDRYYSINNWPNLIECEDAEIKWCYILAKNGNINAQYELAVWFMNGHKGIIPINEEASLGWLEKAALQGHPLATQLFQAINEANL